ncbi:hypothetical protein EON65_27245 [archaeon]|nr:MAG: hypothetical protein EON65_27245 [archaeon]
MVFIGELLHVFFQPLQVFHNPIPQWKFYFDLENKNSTTTQSLGMKVFNKVGTGVNSVMNTRRDLKSGRAGDSPGREGSTNRRESNSQENDLKVEAYVYHHGEEIYLELHVYSSHNKIDLDNKLVDVLNNFSYQNTLNIRLFSRVSINDLIILIQPNYTEIFEGKNINNNSVYAFFKEEDFYRLLSNMITLDCFNQMLTMSVVRARYLVLTKLTVISNYNVRLEIYEERFGELLVLIYGLPNKETLHHLATQQKSLLDKDIFNKIEGLDLDSILNTTLYSIRISRHEIFKLLNYCDSYEKDKLEAFDTIAMAYIFTDRLFIAPSMMWRSAWSCMPFLPYKVGSDMRLNIRYRGGPGRMVGKHLLNLAQLYLNPANSSSYLDPIYLLLTIYEINTPSNSHELRIVLYYFHDCTTLEFRLSAMERILLFHDQSSILDQLISKIKLVYTDLNEPIDRILLKIPELKKTEKNEAFSLNVRPYEVDGDDEYEICSQVSDDGSGDELDQDDEDDSFGIASIDEEASHKKSNQNSHSTKFKVKKDSGWGWALSFDRALLSELRGNLIISATLCLPKKGFNIYVYDPRSFYEVYRFLSYYDSMAVLGKNLQNIEEEISNLDESNVLDLLDEVLGSIDVIDNDDEGLTIVLIRDKPIPEYIHTDNFDVGGLMSTKETAKNGINNSSQSILSDIRSINSGNTISTAEDKKVKKVKEETSLIDLVSRKREMMSNCRVTLEVLRAKDLTKVSTFGAR